MKNKIFPKLSVSMLLLGVTFAANASPIAHWGFDETSGSIAYDSVGAVNGQLLGGVTFTGVGGVVGGAVQFTDGYITMGNNFGPSSAFSIEAWVKITPGATYGMTPVSKHIPRVAQGYFLSINNIGDGYTRDDTVGFYSANGSYQTAVGGPTVNDGLWHQLVGVYDNGITRIYRDGQLAGSGWAGYANNGAEFIVGGLLDGGSLGGNLTDGSLIDEVSVYGSALSGAEIQSIYNATISQNQNLSVPEPTSMVLLGLGLAGLAVGKMRRKNT